jgi:hypothetical protein
MNRNKLTIGAVVLLGVFLAGFLPEYIRANRLAGQVEQARSEQQLGRARDLLGMVFLQTSLKNYGTAQQYAGTLFNEVRALSGQEHSSEVNQALQKILAARDDVTAQLARGDPASYGLIQGLYQVLLQASNPGQKGAGA